MNIKLDKWESSNNIKIKKLKLGISWKKLKNKIIRNKDLGSKRRKEWYRIEKSLCKGSGKVNKINKGKNKFKTDNKSLTKLKNKEEKVQESLKKAKGTTKLKTKNIKSN